MCSLRDATRESASDEQLKQDMIAVPIGPRIRRFATAASPGYLEVRGRPEHPRDLLGHACLRGQFHQRRDAGFWEFERDGEVGADRSFPARWWCGSAQPWTWRLAQPVAGLGIIHLFEDWLRPALDEGSLEPILEPWWQRFSGPVPLLSQPSALTPAASRAAVRLYQTLGRAAVSFSADLTPQPSWRR